MRKIFSSPKTYVRIFAVASWFAVGLMGCRHSEPNVLYMPDMVYSPAFKAQKVGSMKMPVKGTVSRDFETYPYPNDPEMAERNLKNPLRPTSAVMTRGEHVYKTNCVVCHGNTGEGDGTIVPKFPRPPSLESEKVRNWTDGRIYHTITMGQNLMPSYASQIAPGDRWAVVYYLRALQRAKHPKPEDLKIADQESK